MSGEATRAGFCAVIGAPNAGKSTLVNALVGQKVAIVTPNHLHAPAAHAFLDAGIDVARISGQVKASSIKKISEVVASHPDESLAIIRSWLAEEPSERAA